MARFTVYSKNDSPVCSTGDLKYVGTYLKPAFVEIGTMMSPSAIGWSVGDYVDYRGVRYRLYDIPQPTKQARPGTYGAAFEYSQVQFHAPTKALEICPFRDIVFADNNIHFTTYPIIATFEDIYGIADRIQANLDSMYPGEWTVEVFTPKDPVLSEIYATPKNFSLSDGSILDALDNIFNLWKYNNVGIGWVYDIRDGKNVITIGRPTERDNGNTSSPFLYGRGKGLKVIRKSISANNEIATRLYVYGSTRNMPARWYNRKYPNLANNESVYIPNLMIPVSKWGTTGGYPDASKAYIESSEGIKKWGLRPKTIVFGEGGEWEEIYPTIERVTAKELRDAKTETGDTDFVPRTDTYPDSERLDEILGADLIEDDGLPLSDSGLRYLEKQSAPLLVEAGSYSAISDALSGSIYNRITLFETRIQSIGQINPDFKLNAVQYPNASSSWLICIQAYKPRRIVVEFRLVEAKTYTDGKYSGTKAVATQTINVDPVNDWYPLSNDTDTSPSKDADGNVDIWGRYFVKPDNLALVYVYEGEDKPRYYYIDAQVRCYFGDELQIQAKNYDWMLNGSTCDFLVTKYIPEGFTIRLKQIGFDMMAHQGNIAGSIGRIHMKDGSCAGRSFLVKLVNYRGGIEDGWMAACVRQYDTVLNQYFPNSTYQLKAGDHFVLTDISMPDEYVHIASQRLYNRGLELSGYYTRQKHTYEPDIDSIQMQRWADNGTERILKEGMYFAIEDEDVTEGTEYVIIDTLSIDESTQIPTYEITLRDDKTIKNTSTQGFGSIGTDGETSADTSSEAVSMKSVTGLGDALNELDLFYKDESSHALRARNRRGLYSDSFVSVRGADPMAQRADETGGVAQVDEYMINSYGDGATITVRIMEEIGFTESVREGILSGRISRIRAKYEDNMHIYPVLFAGPSAVIWGFDGRDIGWWDGASLYGILGWGTASPTIRFIDT